jgi:hypothetical protein
MSLCLISTFKNESHILKEWITHYLDQGVDKFLLTDNNSNDDYLSILQPYIDSNIVELKIDTRYAVQTETYNEYLQNAKQYDWALVCDLDEFVYARNEFRTIKDYLYTLPKSINQIFIPWKIFGSNGFDSINKEHPDKIVKHFTKRINYNKNTGFQGVIIDNNIKYSFTKCIVRPKYLNNFDIHGHCPNPNNSITSDNLSHNIHSNNQFCKIDEDILAQSNLHLNHYAIQSFEWFMRIKATRGALNDIKQNNVRNEQYFRQFDSVSNDITDLELSERSTY